MGAWTVVSGVIRRRRMKSRWRSNRRVGENLTAGLKRDVTQSERVDSPSYAVNAVDTARPDNVDFGARGSGTDYQICLS